VIKAGPQRAAGVAWKDRVMRVFLETQRLVLRQFTMADVDNLVSA